MTKPGTEASISVKIWSCFLHLIASLRMLSQYGELNCISFTFLDKPLVTGEVEIICISNLFFKVLWDSKVYWAVLVLQKIYYSYIKK